jgi:hypothetical protein
MFQQLACVAAGAVRDFGAGEHAREFFDAAGAIEFVDTHLRAAAKRLFLYDQVIMREARDLRLVRDA